MDRRDAGHSPGRMLAISPSLFPGPIVVRGRDGSQSGKSGRPSERSARRTEPAVAQQSSSFESIYDEHFDFVWRSVRRLGVPEAQADDAVQDVFLVVHRRLGDFEGRSKIKTWVFGIALKIAKNHRRRIARKGMHEPLPGELATKAPGPDELTEKKQAAALLDRLLGSLDEDKRAVFVLSELEGMTAPEIGEALNINVNTVYSRLRAARRGFNEAVKRQRAQVERRAR